MSRAAPLHFGPQDRPLFGWLHRSPSPESSSIGLVICNPFGFESVCAHRSLRHFATHAAAAGIPALRFDYDGTGDSAGDDHDPGRLAAWIGSIKEAVATVRALTGVERVVLLGVRLGAMLAALAAIDCDDIDSLVAIAPVVSGKRHVRELRALQMALGLREPPAGALVGEGVEEAIGFILNAETKIAITQIDLTKLEKAIAPAVLLLDRDDLPGDDAWADRLTSQSVSVERRRLPGYVEMMLAPHESIVPDAMVKEAIAWLRERAQKSDPRRRTASAARHDATRDGTSTGTPAAAKEPPRVALVAPRVVESPQLIGERLFGVLSAPASTPPSGRALLLLSAGAVHRIGPNRLHVALARRWAELGHTVLRLDIAGIGDSLPRPGDPENVVYTDRATDDVGEAIAFLRRQAGVTEIHALGMCSGGYHAFKAAVADVPMDGVLLINPLVFFFKKDASAVEIAAHETTITSISSRALSLETWKRLLEGGVDLKAVTKVVARRALNLARDRARELARRANIRLADDLAYELQYVVRKNVDLKFLFTQGDPGISLLAAQGGAMVDDLRRRGQLGYDIIDGPDHTFTPVWSHPVLERHLASYYDTMPAKRGGRDRAAVVAAIDTTAGT